MNKTDVLLNRVLEKLASIEHRLELTERTSQEAKFSDEFFEPITTEQLALRKQLFVLTRQLDGLREQVLLQGQKHDITLQLSYRYKLDNLINQAKKFWIVQSWLFLNRVIRLCIETILAIALGIWESVNTFSRSKAKMDFVVSLYLLFTGATVGIVGLVVFLGLRI